MFTRKRKGQSFQCRKAIIQAVDTDGKLMTTGGEKVDVILESEGQMRRLQPPPVQDNKDGTYTFEYSTLWDQVNVKINGTPMTASPFQLTK